MGQPDEQPHGPTYTTKTLHKYNETPTGYQIEDSRDPEKKDTPKGHLYLSQAPRILLVPGVSH